MTPTFLSEVTDLVHAHMVAPLPLHVSSAHHQLGTGNLKTSYAGDRHYPQLA